MSLFCFPACSLKAESWNLLTEVIADPTQPDPGGDDDGNNTTCGPADCVFPVDVNPPFFHDDFNRANQLLTTDLLNRWWARDVLSVPTQLTDKQLSGAANSSMIIANPNIEGLAKVYLETSIRITAPAGSKQFHAIVPYARIETVGGVPDYNLVGCVVDYASNGDVGFYVGDFMSYAMGTLPPVRVVSSFPISVDSYFGCEVDQATKVVTAYVNSIKVGETTVPVVPAAMTPLIYSVGPAIVADNAKAFHSFLEGRKPNDGDLQIYNTPFAGHYLDQLSNFTLMGYCADNGATVQVKNLGAGGYQSATAVCSGNHFSLALDLSDPAQFPVGPNTIRIEYVNAGGMQEYFWSFKNLGQMPVPQIAAPSPAVGSSTTELAWVIHYPEAASIGLSAADVMLSGTATQDCTVRVDAVDGQHKKVVVTGCTGDGTVMIAIPPGTAVNGSGVIFSAAGPSTSAVVANTPPSIAVSDPTPTIGNSSKEFVFTVTYSAGTTVDLTAAKITLIDGNGDPLSTLGCSVAITSDSDVIKKVKLTGCSGDAPSVGLQVSLTSASNPAGNAAADAVSSSGFVLDNTAPTLAIVRSNSGEGDASTSFLWEVQRSWMDTVDSSKMELFGTNLTGCVLSGDPWVSVTGCTALLGQVGIRLKAGYVTDAAGNTSAQVDSLSYAIVNPITVSAAFAQEYVDKTSGATTHQLNFTLDRISTTPVQVTYDTLSAFSKAQVGVDHNLPLTGSVTIPAGSLSASISYQHINSVGSKILQVGISQADGAGVNVNVDKQIARQLLHDPAADSGFKSIAMGWTSACGVTKGGTIKCWGFYRPVTTVDAGTSYKEIHAISTNTGGPGGFVALAEDGTVTGLSSDGSYLNKGAMETGPGGYRFSKIVQNCGITASSLNGTPDGSFYCNGGIVDPGTTYLDVSISDEGRMCGVTSANVLKCQGSSWAFEDADPGNLYDSVESVYASSACARRLDGKVYCGFGDSSYSSPFYINYADNSSHFKLDIDGNGCGFDAAGNLNCQGTYLSSTYSPYDSYKYSAFDFGRYTMCAIESVTGLLRCRYSYYILSSKWGNAEGALGDPQGDILRSPVVASHRSFQAVAANIDSVCALTDTSEVYCWGSKAWGRYLNAPLKSAVGSFTQVAGNFALRDDGKIVGLVKENLNNIPLDSTKTYTKVSSNCALTASGKIEILYPGNNNATAVDVISPTATYKDISCKKGGAAALTPDGDLVYGFMVGNPGIAVTLNEKFKSVDAYAVSWSGGTIYGITEANKLAYYRTSDGVQAQWDPGEDYKKVSVGYNHACAITVAGVLKCWGDNSVGQLGDGTGVNSASPVVVDAGTTYKDVAAGEYYTCAVTTSNVLKCWGSNLNGSAALGSTGYKTPTFIVPQ